MSRFIEANNQTMLWKICHKIPEFQSMYPLRKEELFKYTIQTIYDSIRSAYINDTELHQYNCAVLSELVKTIRKSNQKDPLATTATATTTTTTTLSPNQDPNPNPTVSQFEQKKIEYERMNSKPDVPNVSELFKEADEERVQNMDELIEQFEKNRKLDILPPLPESKDSLQERVDQLEKTIEQLKARIEEIEKKIP
jgi:hypothetical protein